MSFLLGSCAIYTFFFVAMSHDEERQDQFEAAIDQVKVHYYFTDFATVMLDYLQLPMDTGAPLVAIICYYMTWFGIRFSVNGRIFPSLSSVSPHIRKDMKSGYSDDEFAVQGVYRKFYDSAIDSERCFVEVATATDMPILLKYRLSSAIPRPIRNNPWTWQQCMPPMFKYLYTISRRYQVCLDGAAKEMQSALDLRRRLHALQTDLDEQTSEIQQLRRKHVMEMQQIMMMKDRLSEVSSELKAAGERERERIQFAAELKERLSEVSSELYQACRDAEPCRTRPSKRMRHCD